MRDIKVIIRDINIEIDDELHNLCNTLSVTNEFKKNLRKN